ncbi:MAG: helix-turn-helix transcriptional regulator [Rhodobacteraceae bacterium]|nr:helix-turn-helix transcriptional regulator [Paracoccaceae bacterium]
MSSAIDSIGTLGIYKALLYAFSAAMPECDKYILRYNSYSTPEFLYYDGKNRNCLDLYLSDLYRIDPFFQICAKKSEAGVYRLRDMDDAGRDFQRYFSFIAGVGICENLTAMFPVVGGTTILLAWDWLDKECLITDEDLKWYRQLHQIFMSLHNLRVEALTARPGFGLLKQNSATPWVVASDSSQLICHGGNWEYDDLGGLLKFIEKTPLGEPTFNFANATWTLDRMSTRNAIAPYGWFLQKKLNTKLTGPCTFEEAFGTFAGDELRPREKSVARLSLQGYHNAAIANKLRISHQVVKNYKGSIYHKMDVTSEREFFSLFINSLLDEYL